MFVLAEDLIKISHYCKSRVNNFIPAINSALDEFSINTPLRVAAFLAQCMHESGSFLYMREIASGEAYEGRRDLGNTQVGDGVRFKGRGPIQITGRANYTNVAKKLGIDCVNHPELLENPSEGMRASALFWFEHGLNEIADKGDFLTISVRINGRNKKTGLPNGWQERQDFYKKAKEVFKC